MPDQDDTKKHLQKLCKSIADELTAGPSVTWCKEHGHDLELSDDFDPEIDDADDLQFYDDPPSGWTWLEESGDYARQYIIDGEGNFDGARVMVAGGGPTVWVDFEVMEVIGTWFSNDTVRVAFQDAWDVEDVLEMEWANLAMNLKIS